MAPGRPLNLACDRASLDAERVMRFAKTAPLDGPNVGALLELTQFRIPADVRWMRGLNEGLALAMVVQGHHELSLDGERRSYGPFEYAVLAEGAHVEAHVRRATVSKPFLSFVLELDPAHVRRLSRDLTRLDFHEAPDPDRRESGRPSPRRRGRASRPDDGRTVLDAVLRAVDAVRTDVDRSILGPLYLQEIAYRLLQAGQAAALLARVANDPLNGQMSLLVEYLSDHLSEPITVSDMASRANLSASAFGRRFREATGQAPYQFLKEMRLQKARDLLLEGDLTVSQVSKEVGHVSVSQFISTFRSRFGTTPLSYGVTRRTARPVAPVALMAKGAPPRRVLEISNDGVGTGYRSP